MGRLTLNLKLLVLLIHHNESTMGSQSSLNTLNPLVYEWTICCTSLLMMGSNTKETSKPSDPIGWEIRFGPKMFTLGSKSMIWKRNWSDTNLTSLSCQMLSVSTKKYSSFFDKLIFELGSSLGSKSTVQGVFWTPSFLDLDLDLKPTVTRPSIIYIRKHLMWCKAVTTDVL